SRSEFIISELKNFVGCVEDFYKLCIGQTDSGCRVSHNFRDQDITRQGTFYGDISKFFNVAFHHITGKVSDAVDRQQIGLKADKRISKLKGDNGWLIFD